MDSEARRKLPNIVKETLYKCDTLTEFDLSTHPGIVADWYRDNGMESESALLREMFPWDA